MPLRGTGPMGVHVSRPVRVCLFSGLILSASLALCAQRGGAPQANRADNSQSLAHIGAGKMLAGDDAFLAYPYNFFCVAGNARAQNNNAPDLEPTKLFDNVYAVGNSETAV